MFGFGSRDAVGFTRKDGTMVAFNASTRRKKKTDRKPTAYNLFVKRQIGQFLPKDRDATQQDYARAMRLVAQLWNRRGKSASAVSVGQSGWTGDKSSVGGVAWGKAERKKSSSKKRKSSKKTTSKAKTSTSKSSAKKQATGTKKSRPRRTTAAGKTGTRKATGTKKATGTPRRKSTKKGVRKSK